MSLMRGKQIDLILPETSVDTGQLERFTNFMTALPHLKVSSSLGASEPRSALLVVNSKTSALLSWAKLQLGRPSKLLKSPLSRLTVSLWAISFRYVNLFSGVMDFTNF